MLQGVPCTRSSFRTNTLTMGGECGVCLCGAGGGLLQGDPSAWPEGSRGVPLWWLSTLGQEGVWDGMWHLCPEWARGRRSLNVPWTSCKNPTVCHPSCHMGLKGQGQRSTIRELSGGGHWDPGISRGFQWGLVLDMKPLTPCCKETCNIIQDSRWQHLQKLQDWQRCSDHSKPLGAGLISGVGLAQHFVGTRGRTEASAIRAGAKETPGGLWGLGYH